MTLPHWTCLDCGRLRVILGPCDCGVPSRMAKSFARMGDMGRRRWRRKKEKVCAP